jgi:glycosyltransferase involved in cell wall biosynthesis
VRIRLFRAFADPYRASMQLYADRLLAGVPPLLGAGEAIDAWAPDGARLSPPAARYWDQYVRYQRDARANAADVNHVVDHGYAHLVRALPAGRSVVTFHDAAGARVPGAAARTRLALRLGLRAIRRAARVIADSDAARRDFLELVDYPPERVRVVHLGVDRAFGPSADGAECRRRYALDDGYLLHVGHTQPYMNVEGALGALARLVRECGVDARLVKVGTPFTGEQQALIDRLGVRGRVAHLGRVPAADLPAIYAGAGVLLYPARHAGFGLPPLEAMACGTPVVASERGALPEILGDAALTADPEDHAAIARHAARLLTDPALRARQRARGLERAGHYDWARTAARTLAVYREVAAG